MSVPTTLLRLGADELASVESFRRLKDTAVLTIMFTDITAHLDILANFLAAARTR